MFLRRAVTFKPTTHPPHTHSLTVHPTQPRRWRCCNHFSFSRFLITTLIQSITNLCATFWGYTGPPGQPHTLPNSVALGIQQNSSCSTVQSLVQLGPRLLKYPQRKIPVSVFWSASPTPALESTIGAHPKFRDPQNTKESHLAKGKRLAHPSYIVLPTADPASRDASRRLLGPRECAETTNDCHCLHHA